MARLALPPLPDVHDAGLPFADLLGEGAGAILDAVAAAGDGAVESARPCQATYHPGRSLTVRWDLTVRWSGGRAVGESFVLTAGGRSPAGAVVLGDGEREVAAWRVPWDPYLPGLVAALDPPRMVRLLGDLGVRVPEATCRLLAYRPGRRAVVRVTGPGARVYLKVVPPGRAESLHRRHELLAGAVPAPRSLGWSPDLGIVVLQAVGGRTLRAALGERRGLPAAEALLGLLDALPAPPPGADAAPGWGASRFAGVVAAVAPTLATRVTELAGRLDEAEAAAGAAAGPPVAAHGDFHEAQLLVDGGRVTGLLDVDTYGPGRRLDDLATMIGHLSTLAVGSPRRARVEAYAGRLLDAADRVVGPVALRRGVAAVVLGLATGPFRVLEPGWPRATAGRVALAERWSASADRVAGLPAAG